MPRHGAARATQEAILLLLLALAVLGLGKAFGLFEPDPRRVEGAGK